MKLTHLQRGLLVSGILFAALMWWVQPSHAHDWYKDLHNSTGGSCCSGNDCAPVPLDAEWVNPTPDGYHVTLTVEQAKLINPEASTSINVVVPYSKVMSPPLKAMEEMRNQKPALYHLCIAPRVNIVYCLFAVPGL